MDNQAHGTDTRTISDYLLALRSDSPTPGGGSAAAYAGAIGAALLAMVCRLTLKSQSSDEGADLATAADRLDRLVDRLSLAAREDEECYGRYRTAAALPKSTDEEKLIRRDAMQSALVQAARSPLASARLALDALREGTLVASAGTIHALSDVETALSLLPASVRGSLVNVNVNIAMIRAIDTKTEIGEAVRDIETTLNWLVIDVSDSMASRYRSTG